jgi:hypothetical protein
MAPRRDSTTDVALAALIARPMATILPSLVTQLNQANATTNQGSNTPHCNFKHFNSCNPLAQAVEIYIGRLPLLIKDTISTYLSIYLSIYLFIYLFIHLSYILIRVSINALYPWSLNLTF